MAVPLLLGAAPGLLKAGASLFGAGKRKRAEQAAAAKAKQAEEDLNNFEFKNEYENQENVFEDATVNQQAAQFQAQQTDQNLSQGLDAITQGGGGGGDAQAIANAALQASQGASANIAGQEQSNQSASLTNQASLNSQEAAGAERVNNQEYGREQQQFNVANTQLGAATEARNKAKADFVGGLGSAVAGGLSAGAKGGSFGEAAKTAFQRQKDTKLDELYSPFKNTGDDEIAEEGEESSEAASGGTGLEPANPYGTYNEESKSWEGNTNKGEAASYTKLRQLYGDDGFKFGPKDETTDRQHEVYGSDYQDAKKEWIDAGKSEESFSDNWGGTGGEGTLAGRKHKAGVDRDARGAEAQAGFRAEQDESWNSLGEEGQRAELNSAASSISKNPELKRKLLSSTAGTYGVKELYNKLRGSKSTGGDFKIEDRQKLIEGLEKMGINPKEVFRDLKNVGGRKETPTKRIKKKSKTPMKRGPKAKPTVMMGNRSSFGVY